MKRILLLAIILAMFSPFVFAQSTIDWTTVHQTIDGFGGNCSNTCGSLTAAQGTQLFSTTAGAGLSIYRDEVPFDYSCEVGSGTGGICTFISTPAITQAQANASDIRFFATSWSPPPDMKVINPGSTAPPNSTCIQGTSSTTSLDPTKYALYTTYVQRFISQWNARYGTTLYAFSPQNEPDYCPNSYGGAVMTGSQFLTYVKNNLGPALNGSGTLLMMPESAHETASGSFGTPGLNALTNPCLTDSVAPTCGSYVGIVATHGYNDSYFAYSNLGSKHLWETEIYIPQDGSAFDPSIANGLLVAQDIHKWLTVTGGSAYLWWRLKSSPNDNQGLIQESGGAIAQRLYVMGQWSRFVRPGWVRIDMTGCGATGGSGGVFCTAFKNQTTGAFAIVAANTNASTSAPTINLTNFPAITGTINAFRTSASEKIASVTGFTGVTTSFTPTLAASSVTTFTGALAPSGAPPWTGVIDPKRAIEWSNDGLPGDVLPDSAWPICATIAPYTGTDATITNALAACNTAHPTGGVVVLQAGTFTLSSGINFPNNTTGHLALRGQAANSTILQFTGSRCSLTAFGNAFICAKSTDNSSVGNPTAPHWAQVTSGQTKGSTQLILSSLNTAVVGSVLVLNQCDTGFTDTGLATPCTGTPTDNLGYFHCASYWTATNTGCGVQGEGSGFAVISWRTYASEMEAVVITAINAGGCGATCVTISKPIENPDWGNDTQAVVIQPLSYVGIENLQINSTGVPSGLGVFFGNTLHAWVSGVSFINQSPYGISLFTSFGPLVKDSYFFGNISSGGDHAAILTVAAANPLIQNNIFHVVSGVFYGGTATPTQAGVIAYNFTPVYGHGACGAEHMVDFHGAGQAYTLLEGNIGFGTDQDGDHGASLSITDFRNVWTGWVSNGNGQCGTSSNLPGQNNGHDQNTLRKYYGSRYNNVVFDRLGTPGYTSVYQSAGAFDDLRVYTLGVHQGSMPVDNLVASTTMLWGNWDTVNGSDQFNSAEVPTSAPSYPNAVPSNHSGPASFYLTSKPSWVASGKPWPLVGPDVSGGNLGVCSGTLNASGLFNGVPATSPSQCRGSGLSSAWANTANSNPAADYYFQLGGLPDGSGPALTTFDASHYYSGGSGSPTASWSAPNCNFGTVSVNSSAQCTVNLQNTGSAVLNVSISLVGGTNPYTFSTSCGPTLAAGTNCPVTVTFAPLSATTFSNTLRETDSGNGITADLPLSGTGANLVPNIVLSSTSLNFGTLANTSFSAAQIITITNNGPGSYVASNVTLGGAFPTQYTITSNTCGIVVPQTLTCQIGVSFTPTQLPTVPNAPFGATIIITSNAASSPDSVSLTGISLPIVQLPSGMFAFNRKSN